MIVVQLLEKRKTAVKLLIISGQIIFKRFLSFRKKKLQNEVKEKSLCSATARERIAL